MIFIRFFYDTFSKQTVALTYKSSNILFSMTVGLFFNPTAIFCTKKRTVTYVQSIKPELKSDSKKVCTNYLVQTFYHLTDIFLS